jgi:hypothetical protein
MMALGEGAVVNPSIFIPKEAARICKSKPS